MRAFAIKAEVQDPRAASFAFAAQKTLTSAEAVARKWGIARQTPRVSITVRRTALAIRSLGRSELKPFTDWKDGQPRTELNFKFYRQATNKIVGISDEAAAFLDGFFHLPKRNRGC
ncbi:MAG TPA: hypothetical protein VFT93_04930 [Candidatus Eisenbacteria bacterium]|nr:hypothetical protein [Candidatus Eisenbacteria bacterium]